MTSRRIWFTPRALRLHAVILVVVPAFMALCVWQLERALAGNTLSWAYVFEWPLFAGYAVYMWWRFVHEVPEAAPSPMARTEAADGSPTSPRPPEEAAPDAGTPVVAAEDAELAAYNKYLAQLAEKDRAARHGRQH